MNEKYPWDEPDTDTFEYPWTLVDPKERALDARLFKLASDWFWDIDDDDAPPSWWIKQGMSLYRRGTVASHPEASWLFHMSLGSLLCRRVGLYLLVQGVHRAEAAEMGVPHEQYSNDFWKEVFKRELLSVTEVMGMRDPL